MDAATRDRTLDEADYSSHSTNTLGKFMNTVILHPAMDKLQGRLGSSTLVRQPIKKENSEFEPIKLRLKIDLVSKYARVEGLVNKYFDVPVLYVRQYATGTSPFLLGKTRPCLKWLNNNRAQALKNCLQNKALSIDTSIGLKYEKKTFDSTSNFYSWKLALSKVV